MWAQILLKVTGDLAVHPASSWPHIITCKDNSLVSIISPHHQWDQFTASNNLSPHLGACYLIILSQEVTFDCRWACVGWGWSSPCLMGHLPEGKNIGLSAGREWEAVQHVSGCWRVFTHWEESKPGWSVRKPGHSSERTGAKFSAGE